MAPTKPIVSNTNLVILSFIFLGIQFGFVLEINNISAIYELMGISPNVVSLLWIIPPLSGLFVQPIIGLLSDRINSRYGKRKPFILIGGLLTAISLYLIPQCNTIITIIILIWIFNCVINIAMVSVRAYAADQINSSQLTLVYSIQGILCAFASIIASMMPWILDNVFKISNVHKGNSIPESVVISYSVGALVMLISSLITFFGRKEINYEEVIYPQENVSYLKDIFNDFFKMPKIMLKLCIIEFFAWGGMFGLFIYFPIFVPNNIFHSSIGLKEYNQGIEWVGICFTVSAIMQFLFPFFIPSLTRIFSKKYLFFSVMIMGGIGLIGMYYASSKYYLLLGMACIGIMFAGLNVIPFSIIAAKINKTRMATFMGIFNVFITLPGILVSTTSGIVIKSMFNNDRAWGVVLSGISLLIAAFFILWLRKQESEY